MFSETRAESSKPRPPNNVLLTTHSIVVITVTPHQKIGLVNAQSVNLKSPPLILSLQVVSLLLITVEVLLKNGEQLLPLIHSGIVSLPKLMTILPILWVCLSLGMEANVLTVIHTLLTHLNSTFSWARPSLAVTL